MNPQSAIHIPYLRAPRSALRTWKIRNLFFTLLLLLLLAPSLSLAQVKVSAQADPAQATIGESIRYRVTVETSGADADANPAVDDWGGLTLRGGPLQSANTSISIINGVQTSQRYLTYEWELTAPRAGRYTISAPRVSVGGKTYQADPVTLEAGAVRPAANLPDDFKNEPILSARTDDPEINRQLEGRLFLRAIVSNKTPFIREPVIITYLLYRDNIPMRTFMPIRGENPGALIDELSYANQLNFQNVTVSGKTLQVAQLWRMAFTPTKPGKIAIQGISMRIGIPLQQRRNDPFNDPFFSSFMGDSFNSVTANVPSPPVELDVRPLPTQDQPPDFTGTVGDFAVTGTPDRTSLSEDDLLTLRLNVEGRGSIDLAYPPAFPKDSPDFQLVGQSAKATKKANNATSIGGQKSFELVLRPRHAGDLHLPAIRYPVFNPATGRYVALSTSPSPVTVTPGKSGVQPAQAASPENGDDRPQVYSRELRFVHTVGATRHRTDPLLESWGFWSAQLVAAGLMLGAWRRHRTQSTLDPARKRRDGAWRRFERQLGQIRSRQASAPQQELAGHVDQTARAFIADRFNLSADGLTRVDIERLLLERAVPEARVQRLCDLLENCEALRYAPLGAPDGELAQWTDEIVTILKENVRE